MTLTPDMTEAERVAASLVEKVARLIDPSSWSVMDAELARMLRKYAGERIGYPSDQFQHKESMVIARAIIPIVAEACAEIAETAQICVSPGIQPKGAQVARDTIATAIRQLGAKP